MVPYLRAANVKDGYLDLTDVKEMNFTPTEQKVFSLKPGDVLVTEGSGSLSAVGASAVWDGEIDGVVCFQNTLLRIRPRPGTDGRYLAWWCRSAFGDGLFASSTTGANIFHLSSERVRELPMARVPIADQNVIADYLDAETQHLNTLIASKSYLRGLLAERRQATTWLGVSGSLTYPVCSALAPSGIPWTSELPVGWRAARLNLIARLGSGHTPSRDHPEWRQDCTIPWITTGEVAQVRDDRIEYVDSTRESISELGMANSSAELHPAETVVLSRTASAGFSAIMRSEMATSQDFATW
jgi:type I restriction enzyme S subunit